MEAACCTNSICTPSRASILTGTYSHVNRACSIHSQFDHRVGTFPEALHDAGYQTAVHGKWHLGTSEVSLPRGMDDWSIFPDQGAYVDPVMIDPAGEETVPGYATDRSPPAASTSWTVAIPSSPSASSSTTRRPTAPGSRTPATRGATRRARSPSRRPSPTTTPVAARRCGASRCAWTTSPSPT
ncbi:hypothetical protein GCM10028787_14340 [Brachybacterium horti]